MDPVEEPPCKKLKVDTARVVSDRPDPSEHKVSNLGPIPQEGKRKNKQKNYNDGIPGSEPPTAYARVSLKGAHDKVRAKFQRSIEKSAKLRDRESLDLQLEDPGPATELQHDIKPLPQPISAESASKVSEDAGLPEWIRNPIFACEERRGFGSFILTKKTVDSLQKQSINETTPIQTAVLPLLLPGSDQHKGDLCVSAATGSGKTLAYALPLIENFREKLGPRLRGLVVVPTRELVNQVRDVLQTFSGSSDLKIGVAVGNRSLKEEKKLLLRSQWVHDPKAYRAWRDRPIDDLDELMDWDSGTDEDDTDDRLPDHVRKISSAIDVLVCTPGRLVDHIRHTKDFNLHDVEFLVVDEADRLLDESFQEWLSVVLPELEYLPPIDVVTKDLLWVIRAPPRKRHVRKVVVSATMTKDVSKLADLGLRKPRLVVPQRANNDNLGGLDNTVGEDTRSSASYQIPSTLAEYASQGLDTQDKPLYLLDVLGRNSIPRKRSRSTHSTSSMSTNTPSETDTSESSGSSSNNSQKQIRSSNIRKSTSNGIQPSTGTLIFTNSNESANRLSRLIELLRPQVAQDLFTLTKSSRSSTQCRALKALKTREIIIVATDRASRGLDIQNLARVINYEMPKSVKDYVHRVGRTARAGNSGEAFTLVADNEPGWFWNVIAKGGEIERSGKVQRMSLRPEGWNPEEHEAYQDALRKLGEDVKGH